MNKRLNIKTEQLIMTIEMSDYAKMCADRFRGDNTISSFKNHWHAAEAKLNKSGSISVTVNDLHAVNLSNRKRDAALKEMTQAAQRMGEYD